MDFIVQHIHISGKGKGSTDMSPSPAFELDMLSCSRHIYWLDVISSPISHCMTEIEKVSKRKDISNPE